MRKKQIMSTDHNNPLVNRCLLFFVILLPSVINGCKERSVPSQEEFINVTKKYESSYGDIFEAAEKGTVEDVKYFIERGATVNEKDFDGKPLIHYAVMYNPDADVLKYLIERGVDVNAKDKYGTTPLHFAASSYIEILKYLVEKGADVNAKDNYGKTPLHYAAFFSESNIDVLKYLVENGADVNVKDNYGKTPLHYAAAPSKSSVEALKYLIEQGVDVNVKDKSGRTLLALVSGNKEMEAILCEAGAKLYDELLE